MAKKRNRKSYTSKKTHSSVSSGICRAVRADRTVADRLAFISNAWKQFKNPWVTVENPDKSATNRKFIRVRTNDWWGNPKFVKDEK